jgi:hypothetical protein
MIRRFIYDPEQDRVVDVGEAKTFRGLAYETVVEEHKQRRDQRSGEAVKQAALERAERREFSQRKFGTESRWRE